MKRFCYARAHGIAEAIALLNEPGWRSRVLAGGTDLLLLLRENPETCDRVVDISQIAELRRMERRDGQVFIGSAATFTEIMENPLVMATSPVLIQACRQIGGVQIRNMATIGGNVANAAACADSLPALVCLQASAHLATPQGTAGLPVEELVLGPNRTLIPPGGLLTGFSYSVPEARTLGVFLKLGRRNAMAISRVTVAAMGRLDPAGAIAEARLVPGSVTPRASRFTETERRLLGRLPSAGLFEAAAAQSVEEMRQQTGRRWSSEHKEPALRRLVAQALQAVFGDGTCR